MDGSGFVGLKILVSLAGQGIGQAIAYRFVSDEANVVKVS
jgi:NAD(P)-dependent dehydrogenase (short-subunit alcohol dehydrogenase family)